LPRTIYFEGRTIQVPDDTSDEDIRGILSQGASPVHATGARPVDPRFLTTIETPVAGGAVGLSNTGQNPNASRVGMSLFYAAQQDPDQYARLLHLQDLTGIPPIVSAGNEKKIQQMLDARRIDPQAFTAIAPRTAVWATNPDNAAVAGVDEVQRFGGIEQDATAMRAAAMHAAATHAATQNYALTATNPETQHHIGTNDGGSTWFDVQTGEKVG